MNEKNNKIDINGSVMDSVRGLAWTVIGVLLITAIFLSLIAPVLAPFIQEKLSRKPNGGLKGPDEMPDVWAKMVLVKIGLWIICLGSWTLLIVLNHNPGAGNGFVSGLYGISSGIDNFFSGIFHGISSFLNL